ncbi:MAG: pyridoxal 5'-phosphate synthase glutaminase subunit PdxT [FCB group bacterium]|nr:pyridoxal 5'-phosphate synthase glutaminase subunit PdxT [FCB group bacterium]
MKVGVLSLQGDFAKHHRILEVLGMEPVNVRYPRQLDGVEGLIIPGGESTTMTKLIRRNHFFEPLIEFGKSNPVMGTCAGLILMATEVPDARVNPLGLLDITVERNAYGRQVHSFTDALKVSVNQHHTRIPATFIRAPKITALGDGVRVVAVYRDEPVAVQQDKHIGLAFHPELDDVPFFHNILFGSQTNTLIQDQPDRIHAA